MKLAKRITGIVTAAIMAISMCGGHMFSEVQPLIVEAESISDELQYKNFLYYQKVDEDDDGNYDYVEITNCDKLYTDVVIPGAIDGLAVTSIGAQAFYNHTNLMYVEIPDSVTAIETHAFFGCERLASIVIPDSVTSIGDLVFYNCTNLEDVTISKKLTSIGRMVFGGTPWLENKRAENPFVVVNDILIDGTTCSGDIVIPDNVKTIATRAFEGCSDITGVKIPEGVVSIEDKAFYNCLNLTEIEIPDSITNVGGWAFCETPWLENKRAENPLVIDGDILISGFTLEGDVVIPSGVKIIAGTAFSYSALESVKIPDTVSVIGDHAFYWCENLSDVTIPESVKCIRFAAFAKCINLKSLQIDNPGCEIYDTISTISNDYNEEKIAIFDGTIYGYTNSTAQAYAEKYERKFVALDEPVVTTPVVTTTITTTTSIVTTTTTTTTPEITTTSQIIPNLSEENLEMMCGDIAKLRVENYDGDEEVKWLSNDDNVCTIDEYGRIIAINEGKTFVMALIGNRYLICTVTVYANPSEVTTTTTTSLTTTTTTTITTTISEITTTISETLTDDVTTTNPIVPTLSEKELNMMCGDKVLLKVENYDGEVKWLSGDENIVAVDEYGQVTALNEGTAYVMAIIEDMYLTCTVTVSGDIATDFLLGDANLDGKVNVRDCAFIAQALANGNGDELPVNADFNEDEKKNVRDAAALASYLSKKQ